MQTPEQKLVQLQDAFRATKQPLRDARELTNEVYVSKEIQALEKERIFLRSWLCVAHEDELGKPGDYRTFTLMDEPFVVTRNGKGEIRAFLNMCLHRGTPVAAGNGNARRFTCPYHAWTYDLDGALVAAPHMERCSTNVKRLAIRPLRVAIWRGWVFVNLDPSAPPFEDYIEQFGDKFWWFDTAKGKFIDRVTLKMNCNWKLGIENIIDLYHGPVVHGASFGAFFKIGDDFDPWDLLPNGAWIMQQQARPHSKTGNQLFDALPWLEGREGYDADWSVKGGLFPFHNLSMRYDSVRMWVVWPTSIDTCEFNMYTVLAPTSISRKGFASDYQAYKDFIINAVADEDGAMVASLQNAVKSQLYSPGPMSHLEAGVHHVMSHYVDVLTGAVDPVAVPKRAQGSEP